MSVFNRIMPEFWKHQSAASGPFKHLFNFRRIWYLAVLLTSGVALAPLIFMAIIDYRATRHDVESEIFLRAARTVSNARRTVSFFLSERMAALNFIVQENSFESLNNPVRLKEILGDLKKSFGGFIDIGAIDALGCQRAYEGPYQLKGRCYADKEWYRAVIRRGSYVSDVFMGYRQVPHMVIAIKHTLESGSYYVLRATLDTEKFKDILSNLVISGNGEAFMINHEGTIQTPSKHYGGVLENVDLPIPEYSDQTEVFQTKRADNATLVIGYRYIPEAPFILIVVKHKEQLMEPWYLTRLEIIGFSAFSILIIVAVILVGASYLVNKIYIADQNRVMSLHQVEYSNKMASLGRLAAGVAHEINNPLAIINEKAGLLKDIFNIKKQYSHDEKLMDLADKILISVERCAAITSQLLGFARHMKDEIQTVNLEAIINEVLGFQGKEAEYRSLKLTVAVAEDVPVIEINRGKLQQILLNLINNAFAALPDGGHLDISAVRRGEDFVSVSIADDGCGIPEKDQERIFEPFFSTKTQAGGTGLGLPITFRLVKEIGGSIEVRSEVGQGTTFVVTLPLKTDDRRGENDKNTAG